MLASSARLALAADPRRTSVRARCLYASRLESFQTVRPRARALRFASAVHAVRGWARAFGDAALGVPDGAQLGWEKITGEVETATESLVYTFFVNPARPAIYELAQYRFVRVEGQRRTPLTEKFVWNKYPSGGKGPQCFALEARGSGARSSAARTSTAARWA